MFSWILEFLAVVKKVQSKVQEERTKKIKGKVKDEALKGSDSVIEANAKVKNSENVIEEEKKNKKLKRQKILIDVLKFVAELFEFSIIGTLIFIGILIFFVALVVILIMFILYGFLTNTGIIPDGSIYTPDDDCIQGTQAVQSAGYDLSAMGQLQGTMTIYQQNLFKTLALYTEVVNQAETAIVNPEKVEEAKKIVGSDVIAKFLFGFSAVETGFFFKNGGDTYANTYGGRDVLEYPSQEVANDLGYAFLGLHHKNTFNGQYKWNGVSPTTCLTDSFVQSWKAKYQPAETPLYDLNFVPYAVATQSGQVFHDTVSGNFSDYFDSIKNELPAIMDEYGIVENREKLITFCQLFASCASYHGGSFDNRVLSMWCALWSATSDVDANRSFDNIKIVYDKDTYLGGPDYTEYTARKYILGSYARQMLWGTQVTGYFEINGVAVDKCLWSWVEDNCSNSTVFGNSKSWFAGQVGQEGISNAYYGLLAYLTANRIVEDLGGTVPIVTGGSIDECDCYDGGTSGGGYAGNIDISNIQTGVAQGPWSPEVLDYLNNGTKNIVGNGSADISVLRTYFGRVDAIENPDKKTKFTDERTVEEWRQQTKWKVPFYVQNVTDPEGGSDNFIPTFASGKGMWSGCHIYMYSYMASALTGRVINAVEMGVGGAKSGDFSYNSTSNPHTGLVSTFNNLGLKAYGYRKSSGATKGDLADFESYFGVTKKELCSNDSAILQKTVDKILSKNGIIGFAMGTPIAYGENHYVVVSEKVGDKYRMMGYNLTPYSGNSEDLYSWDYLFKYMYSHYSHPGYNGQRFYAFNPNLATSVGTSQGTQNSGSNIPVPTPASNAPDDVAQAMWIYLRNSGFSEESAAGIIGNSYGESGLKTDILQGGTPNAAGLFQWESYLNKNGRWKELDNFAKKKGKDWTDFGIQMEYMLYGKEEFEKCIGDFSGPKYPKQHPNDTTGKVTYGWGVKMTLDDYKACTDIEEATKIFLYTFERPSKPAEDKRIDAAKKYYNMFKGTVAGGNVEKITNFEDFLFIGDSLTNQMNAYLNLVAEGADVVAEGSINVSDWNTKYFTNLENLPTDLRPTTRPGYSISVTHSLSELKGVVAMLGSNGFDSNTYKTVLTELLNKVSCNIYVQSIPPCTTAYNKFGLTAKDYKDKVDNYNSEIKAFCDTNSRLYYIETFSNLKTGDGYLDSQYANDEIHLLKSGYEKQYQNILNAINSLAAVSNTSSSVDCITNQSQAIVSGGFNESPGQFQGSLGDLTSALDSVDTSIQVGVDIDKVKALLNYVGTAPKQEQSATYAYSVDKWKTLNGKGFIRYAQWGGYEDWANSSYNKDGVSYVGAGCGSYATASILSTLSGKYINPIEVTAAVATYWNRHDSFPQHIQDKTGLKGKSNLILSDGRFLYYGLGAVIEEYGYKVEIGGSKDFIDKSKVDDCLDNNGFVIFVSNNKLNNRYTPNSGHYVVIREKTDSGYLIYSSTHWGQAERPTDINLVNTWDEISILAKPIQLIYVKP